MTREAVDLAMDNLIDRVINNIIIGSSSAMINSSPEAMQNILRSILNPEYFFRNGIEINYDEAAFTQAKEILNAHEGYSNDLRWLNYIRERIERTSLSDYTPIINLLNDQNMEIEAINIGIMNIILDDIVNIGERLSDSDGDSYSPVIRVSSANDLNLSGENFTDLYFLNNSEDGAQINQDNNQIIYSVTDNVFNIFSHPEDI